MRRLALAALVLALTPAPAFAQKIVIDPGHGGSDPGAVGNGLQEKAVNLDVALRLRDLLQADTADTAGGGSWSVSMTRDSDATVSLAARTSYADSVGADRFMSIHSNAFSSSSANGTETFSYTSSGQSAALRNLVQEEAIAAWGLTDRGNKTADFYVLRETSMPAELHELGFITNAGDAAKLGSPAARQQAAEAHLRAIQRHFGIAPYIPGTAPEPPTDGQVDGVVSGPDGAVVGATVTLDGDQVATTGGDGSYAIAAAAVGEHVVGVAAEGFLPADAIVTVTGGQTAHADFALESDDSDGGDPSGIDGPDVGGEEEGLEVVPDSTSQEASRAGQILGGCTVSGRGASAAPAWLFALALLLGASRRRRER